MGKEAKTNAMRILEREKVPYTAHEYAHEEALPWQVWMWQAAWAKTLPACIRRW